MNKWRKGKALCYGRISTNVEGITELESQLGRSPQKLLQAKNCLWMLKLVAKSKIKQQDIYMV